MEENKTIETTATEELDDEALAKAAGGCVGHCSYECIDYIVVHYKDPAFSYPFRTYKVFRCKDCGAKRYFREEGECSESAKLVEVSPEEYNYFRNLK